MKKFINIHRLVSPVSVLGFRDRAVIWVQGCSNNCDGCIAVEAKDKNGGKLYSILQLKKWILEQADIEGITISGGEPFEQAEAITLLLSDLKENNLGVICYTGLIYEDIVQKAEYNQLLNSIDLLIDGPYIVEQHDSLLWRASRNQRLIFLTQRYKDFELLPDISAGLEFFLDSDNTLLYAGVPETTDFDKVFDRLIADKNININNKEIK